VCRRACGGHGYTHSSGLGSLFADYVGVLTAEGENFLLTQQTGRYLLKAYEKLRRGSAASSDEPKIKYLENVDDLLQGAPNPLPLLPFSFDFNNPSFCGPQPSVRPRAQKTSCARNGSCMPTCTCAPGCFTNSPSACFTKFRFALLRSSFFVRSSFFALCFFVLHAASFVFVFCWACVVVTHFLRHSC